MWVDPTKNEDNVKFYLDDQLLYVGSGRDDAISVDFSKADTSADLTTMHNFNGGFTNNYWAEKLSLVSDDITKDGAYNAVMEFSTVPASPNEFSYGVTYSLFADEGETADDVLDSVAYATALAQAADLPLVATTVDESLYNVLEGQIPDLFPLQLQNNKPF
jgi:hypothetical protein